MTAAKPQRLSRWRSVTFSALLLAAMLGSSASQSCPDRCRSCVGEVADCSESRLSAPPQVYPPSTKIINIEGNHIRVLGSNSFRPQPNIEELKAAGNRIRRLNDDAFWRPLPNLMTLDLSRNRIRRISSRALRNMNALYTLDLSRNQLRSLSHTFHGTPNLYQLKLTRNKLTRLGENDLSPLANVHSIDLRSNNLASVHPSAFHNLTRLRFLYLNDNPLVRMPELDIGSQVLQMVDLSYCRLNAVPKPLPASTREIRLDHNEIVQVNHTDFLSITQLMMFTMNDNKLNFFADGALAHMDTLREVWLRNNQLVYVPRLLPDTVGNIDMTNNKIQEIETGLFRPTAMLQSFTLRKNMINRIAPNTFNGLAFLQSLDFTTNHISVLEPDTFVDLGSLNVLKLSNNPITRIENNAFRNLGNLTVLLLSYVDAGQFELDYNFLPEMLRLRTLNLYASPYLAQSLMEKLRDAGHVTPLTFLDTLDLSHTNLNWVPSRLRQLFPNIRTLTLDGNPLRCTQSLRWLKEWMDEAGSAVNFYQQLEPTCSTPLRLRTRPLSSLLDSEWGPDDEEDVISLPRGGAYDSAAFHGGLSNDQPQEMRMRGSRESLMGSLVKVRGPSTNEAEDVGEAKTAEEQIRPMSMVLGSSGGVRKTNDENGGKIKFKRKGGKRARKDKKGRKHERRGKKSEKGTKKGRKERKTRKNRERKRRRRLTMNRSTATKTA